MRRSFLSVAQTAQHFATARLNLGRQEKASGNVNYLLEMLEFTTIKAMHIVARINLGAIFMRGWFVPPQFPFPP